MRSPKLPTQVSTRTSAACPKVLPLREEQHEARLRQQARGGGGLLRWAVGASLALLVLPAAAQVPPKPANATPSHQRPYEVRLAMSTAAAGQLAEPRFRRLLAYEVGDFASVAQSPIGPLHDQIAYVWIDLTPQSEALMECRLGTLPVVRRSLSLEGLSTDVSARVTAIAVAEALRSQVRSTRPRKALSPRPTPPELAEYTSRGSPTYSFVPGIWGAALPSGSGGWLAGPRLAVDARWAQVGPRVFGSWLTGTVADTTVRWAEAGISFQGLTWLSPHSRLSFGALVAASSVHLSSSTSVDGIAGESSSWSSRAGATASFELRVGRSAWLGIGVEPAMVLRPVPFTRGDRSEGRVEGMWLGVGMSLHWESHPRW